MIGAYRHALTGAALPASDGYTTWAGFVVIVAVVHIVAVVLAHGFLGRAERSPEEARRAEYPWIVAMIGYTSLSLWLLAQPLAKG